MAVHLGHIFLVENYFSLSLKSMRELRNCQPKNMSKHSRWLVVEYRTKLCYIALVSDPSCEVGYNCRHLSSRIYFLLFLVWSKNPSMHAMQQSFVLSSATNSPLILSQKRKKYIYNKFDIKKPRVWITFYKLHKCP